MGNIDEKHIDLLQDIVDGVKESVLKISNNVDTLWERQHDNDLEIKELKNKLAAHKLVCPLNKEEREKMFTEFSQQRDSLNNMRKKKSFEFYFMILNMVLTLFLSAALLYYTAKGTTIVPKDKINQSETVWLQNTLKQMLQNDSLLSIQMKTNTALIEKSRKKMDTKQDKK